MLQSKANLRSPSLEQIADHLHTTHLPTYSAFATGNTAYNPILESLRPDYAVTMRKDARRSGAGNKVDPFKVTPDEGQIGIPFAA